MRTLTKSVLIVGVCGLVICTWANAHALTPRHIPTKPPHALVPPGYDRSLIEVKFIDGRDIALSSAGVPISLDGMALESVTAPDVLSDITRAGGTWTCITGTWGNQIDSLVENAERNLDREIADLSNYYILTVPDGVHTESWLDQLNMLPAVEIALAMPQPKAPLPPDYESLQGYLGAAPGGIGAGQTWTLPGGTGAPTVGDPVRVCDFECGLNRNHQDLPPITELIPPGYVPDTLSDLVIQHGTYVMGAMLSLDNGWGTTGASHGADGYFANYCLNGNSYVDVAITYALTILGPGDVMLLEIQIPGPNWAGGSESFGFVPAEWWEPWYNAVLTAVGNGVHVVECAGNGDEDLGDAVYNTGHAPFLPVNNSGAIMVGAGAAPIGPDVDRSRLTCNSWGSNWGTRLDLQAWGELGLSTGFGGYYSAEGDNYYYHQSSECGGGTSSAGPMVASAVVILESMYESYNGGLTLPPAEMRDVLKTTGSPQQDGSRPATENIGPRPDLIAAAAALNLLCSIDKTGDVDTSGTLTSADIIGMVNFVFKGGDPPQPCQAAADVNCSGTVTSADIIDMVNHVFKGGDAPCDVCSLVPLDWTCP